MVRFQEMAVPWPIFAGFLWDANIGSGAVYLAYLATETVSPVARHSDALHVSARSVAGLRLSLPGHQPGSRAMSPTAIHWWRLRKRY